MEQDQIASLAYLGLLAVVVGGSYIAANRNRLGQMSQQAAIWGLIFIGVIAAAGLWGDIRQTVQPRQIVGDAGQITLPRQADGHYYLTALVNDVPVDFVVDTGASHIVLSRDDARRVGIDPETLAFIGTANTANGPVATAPVRLDSITVEGLRSDGVRAVVNDGVMNGSLLGMTYLDRFSRIEISAGQLVLTP